MTDLEKEMLRQIHELSKEVTALRERVAVVESKMFMTQPGGQWGQPYTSPAIPLPYRVTCSGSTGIAGRD